MRFSFPSCARSKRPQCPLKLNLRREELNLFSLLIKVSISRIHLHGFSTVLDITVETLILTHFIMFSISDLLNSAHRRVNLVRVFVIEPRHGSTCYQFNPEQFQIVDFLWHIVSSTILDVNFFNLLVVMQSERDRPLSEHFLIHILNRVILVLQTERHFALSRSIYLDT